MSDKQDRTNQFIRRGFKYGIDDSLELARSEVRQRSQGNRRKDAATALDLPFESVSEIVHFKGDNARFDLAKPDDDFRWFKVQARQSVWNKDRTIGWDCMPTEIIGFQILVAPGSEPMEVILATHPKTIQVKDQQTGKTKRLRTGFQDWLGRGFCKTQYASDPQCGGIRNFLRRIFRSAGCSTMPRNWVWWSKFLTKATFLRSVTLLSSPKRLANGMSKSLHSWEH